MPRKSTVIRPWIFLWIAALAVSVPAAAAFPPITDEQKKLKEVPGSPGASAVVLFESADLAMQDPTGDPVPSILTVERRIKILTEEGAKEFGEIEIPHSRTTRLSNLEGRTVLADGREVPLPKDAVFQRQVSRQDRQFETSAAFPSVEPGAILDLSYDLYFDSFFLLEPWLFQSTIPTLRSEVTFHIPSSVAVGTWGRTLPTHQFQSENRPEKDGQRLTVWLENLPAIPDEPYGPPLSDLSAKFMVIPHYVAFASGNRVYLMENWKDLMQQVEDHFYKPTLKDDKLARQKAKEIAKTVEASDRALAEAVYRWVRDEIRTEAGSLYVLDVDEKNGVSGVVTRGVGTPAEKGLLLYAMLDELKLDSEILWAPDAYDGSIDPNVANPAWFERVIVAVDVNGSRVFLDPSSPSLAFGRLRPYNEGQPTVTYDPKNPDVGELPTTPPEDHRREASIELTLDEEGRATGTGTLTLTGHHAYLNLDPEAADDEVLADWTEWLEERYEGYEVSDVKVNPSVDSQTLEVTFAVTQRDEEVLGDEATLILARPLGPVDQPFDLPPERRRTPVQFSFADRDELEVTLTWPEGWEVDSAPQSFDRKTSVGTAAYTVETDEEARTLHLTRRLEIAKKYFPNSTEYTALRDLYELMEERDARAVVLVRR